MKYRFNTFDFYLLRVPRLTTDVIYKINQLENKEDVWNCTVNLFQKPEIQDAIYLASEIVFEQFTDVLKSGYTPSADKILETLYKYISRMSSRSTPYGNFSGVALGELTESTNSIELSGEFSSFYRLDMGFRGQLSKNVEENPETQNQLSYYTNSTLFKSTDHFKYIDFSETDSRRNYRWIKISKNPLLEYILDLAKNGKHFQELVETLRKLGVRKNKGEQYVRQLVEIKLLISELEPRVTASSSHDTLSRLKTIQHGRLPMSSLLTLDHCLKTMNFNDKNVKSFTVRKMCREINIPSSKNLFQADLLVGTKSNKISKQIIEELTKEVEELAVINRAKTPNDLVSFRRKFLSRYGDKEIPLLEALDHGNGIGYGKTAIGSLEENPLLQGLGALKENNSKDRQTDIVQSIIKKRQLEATTVKTPIELNYHDIQSMGTESNDFSPENLPLSFYLLGNLILPKNLEDKKKYQFNLLAGGGVSSIPLMTRFAHLDTKLQEKLQDCVDWEEDHAHDVVFAEVVYMPESRIGNILTRPNLFKYEIPIIGQCGVDEEFRISLDDLWISIKEGKIILRSKRLNKQIIPRLSSAHNFHYGMIVYRFLCDLQFQTDWINLSWNWGKLSESPFLPRITYKHIILSRARWNIDKRFVKDLDGHDNKSKIQQLQEKFELPNLILMTQGDNELLLDLRNPVASAIMIKELHKGNVILHEYLFGQYESPVCDSAGARYNNEILIPMKLDNLQKKGIKFKLERRKTVRRSFHPGSEWIYAKIYCGIGETDRILSEQISRLKNELSKKELIGKWFFVRYGDPDPHIRLRFLLRTNDGDIPFQQVVDHINKHLEPLLINNTVFRIVYDTYERELQRYGENTINICESLFHVDSESILRLIPFFKQGRGGNLRWLTGMLGVDYLLSAFHVDIEKKINFVTALRDAFLFEFKGYDKLKYKLDCKYREHRSLIQDFFDPSNSNDLAIHNNLVNRFQSTRCLAESIKKSHLTDHNILDLISSLSHMYINRLFNVKQREHEMIIYHFLTKHYHSIVKRKDSGRFQLNRPEMIIYPVN